MIPQFFSFMLGPILGISAALSWGASDFSGGLSARKVNVWWVVLISQVFGILFLTGLALAFKESFPPRSILLYGALAGLVGEFGLILLYQGLAVGRMGVVAPLSAVLSALLPASLGLYLEGSPASLQLTGMALAIPAIWLVSSGGEHGGAKINELLLGITSGLAFGIFFILIDRVSSQAIFWPLAAARLSSLGFLMVLNMIMKPNPRPTWAIVPLIALAGLLDSTGNLFFAFATRIGRLDMAAVLGSLYPAVTILLAYLLLRERLARPQWLGVGLALGAIVMIAW